MALAIWMIGSAAFPDGLLGYGQTLDSQGVAAKLALISVVQSLDAGEHLACAKLSRAPPSSAEIHMVWYRRCLHCFALAH